MKDWKHKNSRRKLEKHPFDIGLRIFFFCFFFFALSPHGRETKAKNEQKQMELQQNVKVLHGEGSYKQNEKATYWMGEYICKLYNW